MAVFSRHKLSIPVMALAIVLAAASAGAMNIYSAGMVTPETISPVPTGVYGGVYNDGYFIPDPGRGPTDTDNWKVWYVPAGGGVPQVFAPGLDTPPGMTSRARPKSSSERVIARRVPRPRSPWRGRSG